MCPVRAAGGQEQVVGSTGWASQERHSAPCCHLCAQSGCVLELKDGPISQEKLEIWVSRNTMMKRKKKNPFTSSQTRFSPQVATWQHLA